MRKGLDPIPQSSCHHLRSFPRSDGAIELFPEAALGSSSNKPIIGVYCARYKSYQDSKVSFLEKGQDKIENVKMANKTICDHFYELQNLDLNFCQEQKNFLDETIQKVRDAINDKDQYFITANSLNLKDQKKQLQENISQTFKELTEGRTSLNAYNLFKENINSIAMAQAPRISRP